MKRAAVALTWLMIAAALVLLPVTSGNYPLRLATIGFMYVGLASSWNVIGGFAGYPSFATAAFFGLGAYAGAIVKPGSVVPLPLAWLVGALAAGLFAFGLGLAILKLRGHYFAVASLVMASVLREIVNGWTALTGGGMGLNLPVPAAQSLTATAQLYYAAMLAAALLTVAAAFAVSRSRLGWALRCIAQNEDAAVVLGIDTRQAKIAALVISALSAGLTGAIYATWTGYIDPADAFDDMRSINPIVMAFLGGAGTVSGPVAGAVIFLLLEEFVWRNALEFHSGILGIVIVLLLVFLPGGLGSLRQTSAWVWRGKAVPTGLPP